MTNPTPQPRKRRGKTQPENVRRPDVPYTMKLPDGRTLYVEVPGRMVARTSGDEVAFTPEGVRFLDRVRALALPLSAAPRPAFLITLREALGWTQADLAERVGVDKMTVSRWERGTMRPGAEALAHLRRVVEGAKRRGVSLAG